MLSVDITSYFCYKNRSEWSAISTRSLITTLSAKEKRAMTTTFIPKKTKNRKPYFNQAFLKKIMDYDPKTGVFRWKESPCSWIKPGMRAGNVKPAGYRCMTIGGKKNQAARLAWLYVHGYWPENEIDHINRIRDDDRIENLREVTTQCNMRNAQQPKTNTSGVKGVYRLKKCADKNWRARISHNNKNYCLGCFEDYDEAVCHRLAAEQCLDWAGCDSSSPAFCYVSNLQKETGAV